MNSATLSRSANGTYCGPYRREGKKLTDYDDIAKGELPTLRAGAKAKLEASPDDFVFGAPREFLRNSKSVLAQKELPNINFRIKVTLEFRDVFGKRHRQVTPLDFWQADIREGGDVRLIKDGEISDDLLTVTFN